MKEKKYVIFLIILVAVVSAVFLVVRKANAPAGNSQPTTNNLQQTNSNTQNATDQAQQTKDTNKNAINNSQKSQTVDPIAGALARITKKPFGIYITPKTSPVQPERFSGYHSAVDLETTPAEQNIDVQVSVLCSGKLLMARSASGYGGVAVQSCTLDGQAVTIIYGHIRLSSISPKVGDSLKVGDFLANLGTGYSSQTDGERKHLHLGVHKGAGINILGYVQSKAALSDWLDPAKYLTP